MDVFLPYDKRKNCSETDKCAKIAKLVLFNENIDVIDFFNNLRQYLFCKFMPSVLELVKNVYTENEGERDFLTHSLLSHIKGILNE